MVHRVGKVTRATLVCFLRPARRTGRPPGVRTRAPAGFTLLELLVVMSIVALMLGLVVPAGWRALEAAQERAALRELTARLERLPLQAWQSGRTFTVQGADLQRGIANWPASWSILSPEPLTYGANGVAKGGEVSLWVDGQRRYAWRIEPLTGRVVAL